MNAMARRRPAGFTMIELLVVIALLGVLAAIGTGAYFRIRAGQQVKTTEDTVSKLTAAFSQQWAAERDMANDAFSGKANMAAFSTQVENAKAIAGGDADRAKALWLYLWMKNAYPQTAAEATAATAMTIAVSSSQSVTVTLPARTTYSSLSAAGALSGGDQAAAILYLALTQKGTRGQVFNEEATGALSVNLPGTNFRVFTDTFGNPISFARMSSGNQNDANSPEYLKPGAVNRDPMDQFGRLMNWPPPSSLPPPVPPRQQVAFFFKLLIPGRPAGSTTPTDYDFSNLNWVYTVVSRGPDRTWGTFPDLTAGLIPVPDGFIAGYKLRRQGNRGDQ